MTADAAKKIFTLGAFYWIPACVVAYLWIFLAGTAADFLSRWNLDVFTPGLLVVVPALLMPISRGFAVVLVCGFLFDGSLPIPYEKMESAFGGSERIFLFGEMSVDVSSTFGFNAIWMAIFFFVLRFLRSRIDLSSPRHWLVCALSVNLVIFLLWACVQSASPTTPEFWLGFAADAAASSAFIGLLGWWYFDATVSLYRICGTDLVGEREVEE